MQKLKLLAIPSLVVIAQVVYAAPNLLYSVPAGSGNVAAVSVAAIPSGGTYVLSMIVPLTTSYYAVYPPDSGLGALLTRFDNHGYASWSVKLKGSGGDVPFGLAIDQQGAAYVVGETNSPDFPVVNGVQTSCPNTTDTCGFITKVDSSGNIVYSTYLGGHGVSAVEAVAIDSSGAAYVTGSTESTDFPTTPGAYRTTVPATGPHLTVYAFVARLNALGNALTYSTYLGGENVACIGGSTCMRVTASSGGGAIAVDLSGNAYVAGSTNALDFPVTQGAFQTTCNCRGQAGGAFALKLSPSADELVYSTFLGVSPLGGSLYPEGYTGPIAIAVNSAAAATLAGSTISSSFPTTPGALQTTYKGCSAQPCGGPNLSPNGFVAKLNSSGTALVWSTLFGGTSANVTSAAVALDGTVWLAESQAGSDFPITSGAFPRGGDFIAALRPDGSGLTVSSQFPSGLTDGQIAIASD